MPVGYVVNRVGLLLLIIWIAISVNFIIPRLMSGGPAERMTASQRARFGVDQPQWKQYITYWQNILRGDLGNPLTNFPERVINKIKHALPWTLGLLVVSTVLAFTVGTILGALIAWPRTPRPIKAIAPVLMLFSAVPYYLLALILMFFFANVWAIFPPAGGSTPILILDWNWVSVWDIVSHAILPSMSIVLGGIGFWALGMRGMMISVLGEDYMDMAEAKGLSPRRIFFWYGMRNAILPQITAVALAMGFVLSGTVLVEVVFSYPGLGLILFQAIIVRDHFVIQGIALMLILALGFTLLVVDLIYPLIDPRVRFNSS